MRATSCGFDPHLRHHLVLHELASSRRHDTCARKGRLPRLASLISGTCLDGDLAAGELDHYQVAVGLTGKSPGFERLYHRVAP